MRNEYRILVVEPEGKRQLRRPSCRWDNKMCLREIGYRLDSTGSGKGPVTGSSERGNEVQFHEILGASCPDEQLLTSKEGLCYMSLLVN
jgi:hypothetical protein